MARALQGHDAKKSDTGSLLESEVGFKCQYARNPCPTMAALQCSKALFLHRTARPWATQHWNYEVEISMHKPPKGMLQKIIPYTPLVTPHPLHHPPLGGNGHLAQKA